MINKKKLLLLAIILLIAFFLRFFNLMHDSPYFFNPDERNMANAISQFKLPAKLSEIPMCIFSQFLILNSKFLIPNCNLNPHFFAYGQFPLYLAFTSDQISSVMLNSFQHLFLNSMGIPKQVRDDMFVTSFSSAIFWLRFWSAISSVLTVLFVYLITNVILTEPERSRGRIEGSRLAGDLLHFRKLRDSSHVKISDEFLQGKRLRLHWKIPQDFSVLGMTPGIIAALITAFSPGLIQSAHFGTTESLLTFFFMASVYLSMNLVNIPLSLRFTGWRRSNLYNKFREIATVVSLPRNDIILLSIVIGLALGSKLTGIFFFIPPIFTSIIRIIEVLSRKKKNKYNIALSHCFIVALIILGSVFFFVVSSPYNLVDPTNFKSAVFGYESDVAMGRYEAFYTRQFVNTIPIIFQAEKIFPYVLGWPVFMFGTLGFLLLNLKLISSLALSIWQRYKISKIKYQRYISKIKKENIFNFLYVFLIFDISFLIYFLPNAFLFAKWTRFMTPILPFFSIFAGYFLYQISKLFHCHSERSEESLANARRLRQAERSLDSLRSLGMTKLVYWFIGLLVITSILPGLMFMSIYTHEDSRVTASKWIYKNIPNNSYVLSETANVVDIPLSLPTTNHQLPTNNYTVISFDFYHMDENPMIFNDLIGHLQKANYIFIPSRRIFANYPKLPNKYPLTTKYYQLLFSGALGFEKITEISSFPRLPISQIGPISLIENDENVEETFTVFDHPVIRIYRKKTNYNKNYLFGLFKGNSPI